MLNYQFQQLIIALLIERKPKIGPVYLGRRNKMNMTKKFWVIPDM
jgi:hypothetical protein